jgi:membrane protein YdbS with pleckstrin-like domain
MQCRQCGTDIADKALICYKCGAATTDPKFQPPSNVAARSRARFILTFVALILLAGVAMFLARFSPSGTPPWVTWVVAGVAIVIVVLRAYARRR